MGTQEVPAGSMLSPGAASGAEGKEKNVSRQARSQNHGGKEM